MKTLTKIQQTISKSGLFSPGDTIIIGVSGGPDSMALLHILNGLKHKLAIQLHIVHVNHHLRKSSDTDERFVEKVARQLNIPCKIFHVKIPTRNKKGSIEEIAREKRLQCFLQLAKKLKADTICLGHTADDLAETVLMRILRGTGLKGLQAIQEQRKFGSCHVVRPLLQTTKQEIKTYLKAHKVVFRTDPTNRQLKFSRNRVRLELIPLIEKSYNKNIKSILVNLAQNSSLDYAFIQAEAQREFRSLAKQNSKGKQITLSVVRLRKLHESMQRMVLRLSIENLKGDTNSLTTKHISEITDLLWNRPQGAIVDLPSNISVQKKNTYLRLSKKKYLNNGANSL